MKKKIIMITMVCAIGLIGCANKAEPVSESIVQTTEVQTTEEEVPPLTKEQITEIADYYNLQVSHDSFRDVYFYYSKNNCYPYDNEVYISTVYDGMYLYMPQKDNTVYLNVVLSYYGYGWIFFDKVEIKTGGEIYDFPIVESEIERDVDSTKVKEKYDVQVTDEIITILDKIKENGDCTIRFSGEDVHTVELDWMVTRGIVDVFSAYENIINHKAIGNDEELEDDYQLDKEPNAILENSGSITYPSTDVVAVSTTKSNLDSYRDSLTSQISSMAIDALEEKERIFYVPNGTKIRYNTVRKSLFDFEIEILEGEHKGEIGWVYADQIVIE